MFEPFAYFLKYVQHSLGYTRDDLLDKWLISLNISVLDITPECVLKAESKEQKSQIFQR